MAFHASSNAIDLVSVDGSIFAGDTATVMIEDRNYTYTIQDGDSLATVRDALIATINSNPDEKVIATAAGQFTRIVLTAKVAGPDGNGIAIAATSAANIDQQRIGHHDRAKLRPPAARVSPALR